MTQAHAAALAETISFGVALVMVVCAWAMLGQPRRLVRWLAVLQAGLLTSAALNDLSHSYWVILLLAIAPLAAKPHPHVGLARFCTAIMGGMVLAGACSAIEIAYTRRPAHDEGRPTSETLLDRLDCTVCGGGTLHGDVRVRGPVVRAPEAALSSCFPIWPE